MVEENPQKFLRHLKNFEDKDLVLWKENHRRQQKFHGNLEQYKNMTKKSFEQYGQKLLQLEKKIDDNVFRTTNMSRELEGLMVRSQFGIQHSHL